MEVLLGSCGSYGVESCISTDGVSCMLVILVTWLSVTLCGVRFSSISSTTKMFIFQAHKAYWQNEWAFVK